MNYPKQKMENMTRSFFDAIDIAWKAFKNSGAITCETVTEVEQYLKPIAEKAKSYSLNCVGHAHIDMNWMWGYDENGNGYYRYIPHDARAYERIP